jgi:hypothetical protein
VGAPISFRLVSSLTVQIRHERRGGGTGRHFLLANEAVETS